MNIQIAKRVCLLDNAFFFIKVKCKQIAILQIKSAMWIQSHKYKHICIGILFLDSIAS